MFHAVPAPMSRLQALISVPIAALVAGCVSQAKYDQAMADRAQLLARNKTLATDALGRERSHAAERGRLKRSLDELTKSATLAAAQIEGLRVGARECGTAFDEASAINQQLRNELERQGKNVDALLGEKGTLSSALTQTKARLEELRRAQAAAEARAALFRDVALRLRRMVDAGELVISLRSGRMVLALPNDVLFDSGKTTLKPRGKAALEQITAVLKTLQHRKFQVAGHTDDEPIRFSPFQSNWQLATQRALVVVDQMIALGMAPTAVSAAGYAEFDPVAGNDSAEGRAKNRRIEITLQPNVDEFVAVPTAW
jgi:chemotaxis protein MotB